MPHTIQFYSGKGYHLKDVTENLGGYGNFRCGWVGVGGMCRYCYLKVTATFGFQNILMCKIFPNFMRMNNFLMNKRLRNSFGFWNLAWNFISSCKVNISLY